MAKTWYYCLRKPDTGTGRPEAVDPVKGSSGSCAAVGRHLNSGDVPRYHGFCRCSLGINGILWWIRQKANVRAERLLVGAKNFQHHMFLLITGVESFPSVWKLTRRIAAKVLVWLPSDKSHSFDPLRSVFSTYWRRARCYNRYSSYLKLVDILYGRNLK